MLTASSPKPEFLVHLYDAHNHLQDERFGHRQHDLIDAAQNEGVIRMVVNGSCEQDWPAVQALARQYPVVLPSFGYHPWYVHDRSKNWFEHLVQFLETAPRPGIGEIGLDRWKPGLEYAGQEEVFCAQMKLAAERNLPVSIHCLQAWGRLHDLLRTGPRPERGFLLHSYGGPKEMVSALARLGAYFSFPGYYMHERKNRQRETFRHVPLDRLLVETDAPDQVLPETTPYLHRLNDAQTGKPINHPANLAAVYRFMADLRGQPIDSLAAQVEANFLRLFGS